MEKLADKSFESAKKRFIASLVMLVLAVIYFISPIDLIPDALFPVGYLDDIPLLIGTSIYSWLAYRKMKKGRERDND